MKHPALWLSCTSSRSSFSASRGVPRPMTISMDIHTQLGPNMAHSAQNGLVLAVFSATFELSCPPRTAGWITRTWPGPVSSSFRLTFWSEMSVTAQHTAIIVRPSVCRLFILFYFFLHFITSLSGQRLQSRALEPLMLAYWCFS